MSGLVVDLFAGGGGASVGIEAALGRPVDIAIDHDPVALAVHRANHPATRHLEADIWEVKPREATSGAPVDLLWASPDCTHFSVAKGNVPRSQGIRSLAWAVLPARACRAVGKMTPATGDRALLWLAAPALLGDQWQTPLARLLDVDDRLVRRWAAGSREVPLWVLQRLAEELDTRRVAVSAVCGALEARLAKEAVCRD